MRKEAGLNTPYGRYALLALILLALFSLLGYEAITLHRMSGFDARVGIAIQKSYGIPVTIVARLLSFLGDKRVMGAEVVAAAGILAYSRRFTNAAALAFGTAGAGVIEVALKEVYKRPQPAIALDHRIYYAFPSGHATAVTFFFGFLAYLAAAGMARGMKRTAVLAGVPFIILGVGWSRVYLNTHWPTDVLGGYLVGVSWLIIVIGVTRLIEGRRGRTMGETNR